MKCKCKCHKKTNNITIDGKPYKKVSVDYCSICVKEHKKHERHLSQTSN